MGVCAITDYLQKVENIAVLGLLAGGLYVAWKFLKGSSGPGDTPTTDPCAGMSGLPALLCSLGVWTTGYQDPKDEPPRSYDEHGCMKGVTEWCQTLAHCQPLGLTCPRPSQPYVPVYQLDEHGCKIGREKFCDVLNTCLEKETYSENFCVIHDDDEPDPTPIRQIGDLCYFGNKTLNVPPGKDCRSAIEDMCRRFGPDSGWCLE